MSEHVDTLDVVSAYLAAKRAVVESGYLDELVWQSTRSIDEMDAVSFVREGAWVILSSGMRESVVRSRFALLESEFHEWHPCRIVADPLCADRASHVFRHPRKLEAIVALANFAARTDIELIRLQLIEDPEGLLRQFPYVGPVTWRHFAKNLGVPISKPDRHLERLSRRLRRVSVAELCAEVGSWLGEPVEVVDLVLWRWSVLHGSHCAQPGCLGTPHALLR